MNATVAPAAANAPAAICAAQRRQRAVRVDRRFAMTGRRKDAAKVSSEREGQLGRRSVERTFAAMAAIAGRAVYRLDGFGGGVRPGTGWNWAAG